MTANGAYDLYSNNYSHERYNFLVLQENFTFQKAVHLTVLAQGRWCCHHGEPLGHNTITNSLCPPVSYEALSLGYTSKFANFPELKNNYAATPHFWIASLYRQWCVHLAATHNVWLSSASVNHTEHLVLWAGDYKCQHLYCCVSLQNVNITVVYTLTLSNGKKYSGLCPTYNICII